MSVGGRPSGARSVRRAASMREALRRRAESRATGKPRSAMASTRGSAARRDLARRARRRTRRRAGQDAPGDRGLHRRACERRPDGVDRRRSTLELPGPIAAFASRSPESSGVDQSEPSHLQRASGPWSRRASCAASEAWTRPVMEQIDESAGHGSRTRPPSQRSKLTQRPCDETSHLAPRSAAERHRRRGPRASPHLQPALTSQIARTTPSEPVPLNPVRRRVRSTGGPSGLS